MWPKNGMETAKAPYFTGKGPDGGTVVLYLEDCLEGVAGLPPSSVEVVVTSPPYNIGVAYHSHNDRMPREDYLAWLGKVGQQVGRVLADDGSFFLNVGGIPSDPWIPLDVAQELRKLFVLQNAIHWVKSIAINKADVGNYPNITGDIAVGHYKPITSGRFLNDCHEYIFHFTKTGSVPLDRLAVGVPYQDKSNIGRWQSARDDRRCRGNTWFILYQTIRDRSSQRPHPSSFPVGLPEMCIKLHGVGRTKTVLDPFVGIGSTAVACLRLGVSCIGFDTDPEYLRIAAERVRSQPGDGGRERLPQVPPYDSAQGRLEKGDAGPDLR